MAEIILSMKPDWINNFERYFKVNVHERKYLTRKGRKIEDIEIEAANRIMEDKIAEIGENIDLWHINVMQYTTSVTLLGRHGKLRERKTRKYEKKDLVWMRQTSQIE